MPPLHLTERKKSDLNPTPESEVKRKNIVGPNIRRARSNKGWSQQQLAVKLQVAGLDIRRSGVGKIESQLRGVSDKDLFYLLTVLELSLEDLLRS